MFNIKGMQTQKLKLGNSSLLGGLIENPPSGKKSAPFKTVLKESL